MDTRGSFMPWLVILLLSHPVSGCGDPVAKDAVFLLDLTNTEHDDSLPAIRNFLASFAQKNENHIDTGRLRLAAVTYTSDVKRQFGFDDCPRTVDLVGAEWIDGLDHSLGGCIGNISHEVGSSSTRNTGMALSEVRTLLFPDARHDVIKMAVLLISGKSFDLDETKFEAENLNNLGVSVITIGVGHEVDPTELEFLSTNSSYVLKASHVGILNELVDTLQHITEQLNCEGPLEVDKSEVILNGITPFQLSNEIISGKNLSKNNMAETYYLSRSKRNACPSSTSLTADRGRDCAPVNWDSHEHVDRWHGGTPGDCFTHGSHRVSYENSCSFYITVTVLRCSALPSYSHGRRLCKYHDARLYGSICLHRCDPGYKLLPGDARIDCQKRSEHQATWSSPPSTCHEMCNWRNSHCWPGDCENELSANCVCRSGFRKTTTGGAARCELSTPPNLSTCRVSVTDARGNVKNSSYVGNHTDCQSQRDEGIRTQPSELYFAIKADLDLGVGNPSYYVSESRVGVVGAHITVVKISLSGRETTVMPQTLEGAPFCQKTASSSSPVYGQVPHDCEGTLKLPQVNLKDGESLCADIQAFSGGFYNLVDEAVHSRGQVLYPRVPSKKKRVCFIYDMSKPIHCSEQPGGCGSQMLKLSKRLTREPEVDVHIGGWLDPIPPGGTPKSPSLIDVYRVEVHGVDVNRTSLSVQDNARTEHTLVWAANVTSRSGPFDVRVTLPEEEPLLYAIILEVHDKAGNVGYARRLIFFDNSSTVELDDTAQPNVITANPQSNYSWQTDISKQICVDWRERFYNSHMYHNNFLMPVVSDTGREIYGRYDQTSGLLNVRGTDNVQGVVRFEMTRTVDEGNRSTPAVISDVFAQTTCLSDQLVDGQTYDITIKAIDIMDNYKEDSVRVYIDHTGPTVSVQGLTGRFNTHGLYVHNTTDLSTMKLVVHAADPHSGVKTIQWILGTSHLSRDVGEGSVGVHRLRNNTDCQGADNCYCPSVGVCETHHYTFTFTNLVSANNHKGHHHRDYHITVTATNHASIRTARTIDILVDESPPTVGVVWEGLSEDGQAEMDFTSSHELHVHWHGFQDHESGVMLYRVMLAERCMTGQEMKEAVNATEVEQDTTTTLLIPREGRYFTSVVAYNGAMEPSEVACSDGIVYDTTPPTLLKVSITHGHIGRTIGCTQPGHPWLVNQNLTRVRLANTTDCFRLCADNSTVSDVQHFPVSSAHVVEAEVADDVCRKLPMMTEDSYIVLPSDYLKVTWSGLDEESDMEEYYVGMGRDRTTSSAPNLLPFTPMHGHPSYHARHAGLGHGDIFFLFLQVINKAGLHVQRTLGPVVIDVTPPDVTGSLTAEVSGDVMLATWRDGVFVDPEQPNEVQFDFSFRVGHEDGFVTPFLSLPDSSLARCQKDNVTGCVRYPISALHAYDTEAGRQFFFQIHVTNAAGHVTSVNTSSVRLPSHFPPSHGVVLDVVRKETNLGATVGDFTESATPMSANFTPATATSTSPFHAHETTHQYPSRSSAEFSDDVDAVLQRDEICIAWSGFYHSEEANIEIGIGRKPGQDDVISFFPVNSTGPVCLKITSASVYTKFFSVVKATNSGGSTVFSSDGFVLIPEDDVAKKVKVFVGKVCTAADVLGMENINPGLNQLDVSSVSDVPVHTGDALFLHFSPFIPGVTFTDAILLQTTLTGYQIVVTSSAVKAFLPSSASANTSVQVMSCLKDAVLLPAPLNHVTVTWEMLGQWTRYVRSLKVEVMDDTCLMTSPKKEKYRQQRCLFASERVNKGERSLRLDGKDLMTGHTYFATLSPAFDDGVLPPASSLHFTYDNIQRGVTFTNAAITSQVLQDLAVEVRAVIQPNGVPLTASSGQPCLLKWTVARDKLASTLLSDWSIAESADCSEVEVAEALVNTTTPNGNLYVCLQSVYPWTAQNPSCHILQRPASLNHVSPQHVIELSYDTFRQTDFEDYLHSHQLGNRIHELYDLDLDFAESDVMLAAVLTYSEGKSVDWFLMTTPDVPSDGDCASDARCVTSESSETGHVIFPRHRSNLQEGHVYYVCALLTSTSICGNGVVIDDSSPKRGTVSIANAADGYFADEGHVLVTWSGFSDIETTVRHLPDDITMNYSVSLGSYPGSEDLAAAMQVAQRTTWTFDHVDMFPGTTCIATVIAQDRVGHLTVVSSAPFIIDTTPPTVKNVAAGTITQERFVSSQELAVHWEGVEDRESGIKHIEVAVTTESGSDVIPFQRHEESSAILTDVTSLVDGHKYIVLLKVTNGAGLTSLTSSKPFIVDSSPPEIGTVWNSVYNSSDHKSYITEVSGYDVRWSGFPDPHSGVTYYRLALGSAPGLDDVIPFMHVGLQTSYTWKENLEHGKKYYTAVEACNGAGLCRLTSSSSITFDNSPPTSGHVTVGFDGHHSKFWGHTTSLPVQWTGFADPQTGIQEFWWCVGMAPGQCDVTNQTHTLLSRAVHRAGLNLPVATPLYVTVRAKNSAGLDTVSVSDSFTVDPTPPEIVISPHFLSARDGSKAVSQWDRSVLRLAWAFRDPDSTVVSHTVYIRSQVTGRLVVDPVLLGADTQLTLALDKDHLLQDGDHHRMSITACNAAGLCVSAVSSPLLIDSTPPVVGTFLSPLSWLSGLSGVAVNVAWRRFADAESNVTTYYVTAGRRYNGDELSGGQVTVAHDNSTTNQKLTLTMTQNLNAGDTVYFSILAENTLGLQSPVLRMSFDVLVDNANGTSGTLVLIRHSCDVSYCTKECTCAPSGQVCEENTTSCLELDPASGELGHLQVLSHMGTPSGPQQFTTSAKCLEGHWRLQDPVALGNVSRFEWSFSLNNMSAGEGVMDTQTESVWQDVGKNMTAVHCLPEKRMLMLGESYILHVRVWLSRDQHVTFTSSPIVVDHTPPQIKRGGAVMESDVTCQKDVDFVRNETNITICWDGSFRDSQSPISFYEIWIGTNRFAENHLHKTIVGLDTSWNLATTDMEPGTRYYISVRAQNEAGLQTTAVSDGIAIDVTQPITGVAFNTRRHGNRDSQSSDITLDTSWHGFEDEQSGVTSYYVSVYDVQNGSVPLLENFDAGIRNELTLEGLALEHGHRYKVAVAARNVAGLESEPAVSPDILVDVTPPQGVTCNSYELHRETTLSYTPTSSFLHDTYTTDLTVDAEQAGELIKIEVMASRAEQGAAGFISVYDEKMLLHFLQELSGNASAEHVFILPQSGNQTVSVVVEAEEGTEMAVRLYRCSNTVVSAEGAVFLRQISQHAVSVCACVHDEESGLRTVKVGLGTTEGGLQVQPLTPVHHSGHVIREVHVQHNTRLYATVIAENSAGEWSRFISQPLIMDRSGPEVKDVEVTLDYQDDGDAQEPEVNVTVVWTARDAESGSIVCTCRLEGQASVGPAQLTVNDVTPGRCQWQLRHPQHGASVEVAVTCVNGIQLQTSVTSDPEQILLRPPDVTKAKIVSVSNKAVVSPYDGSSPQTRSPNSSLEFCWPGVTDPTISRFHFRFLHESRPLSVWSPLDVYKTCGIVEKQGQSLPAGTVTAQMRASNARLLESDVVTEVVRLDDSKPVLTGGKATLSQLGEDLQLDWRDVFNVNRDVTFSVYAGSARGYGDIINHIVTKETHHRSFYVEQVSEVFVMIEAVYTDGISQIYVDELNI